MDKVDSAPNIQNQLAVVLPKHNIKVACSFLQRIKGLMGTRELPEDEGLLISPCNSVHTFFMRYAIDVVFLSKDYTVLKVIHNMRPWRISPIIWKSHSVLELPSGRAKELGITCGTTLRIM